VFQGEQRTQNILIMKFMLILLKNDATINKYEIRFCPLIIASSSDTLFDDLDLVNLTLLLDCLKYVI
jgi:hypothetical protein